METTGELTSNDRVLWVIVGPTASGKTDLAIRLSRHVPIEVIAADSRTIYRGLDIATAKPTAAEREILPHHLIDVVEPDEPYSLALFQQQAFAAIDDVFQRGRQPVLVGGAGLYVRAVCDGIQIPPAPPLPEFRAELTRKADVEGVCSIHDQLAEIDPESAAKIHPNNIRRVIRALEVFRTTGTQFSKWQQPVPSRYVTRKIGLTVPFEQLEMAIDQRIDGWVGAGLMAEVEQLLRRGYGANLFALSGIGYREFIAVANGELTVSNALSLAKLATRQYARRQITWFKSDPNIQWLPVGMPVDDVLRLFRQI